MTHDDDFVEDVLPDRYRAALFVADDTVSAAEIATIIDSMSKLHSLGAQTSLSLTTIIDSMSKLYPYEELVGLQKTGREWL